MIFFDSSSVTSESCVYEREKPLILTFTKKTQTIIGLSPESIAPVISSLQLSLLFAQLKSNSSYYLIEIINLNKIATYLFILDHNSKNILKDFNDFSRSNNYSGLNYVQKMYFSLEDEVHYKRFRLIEITSSFAMKENLIQAQDVIGLNEILLFGLILIVSLNYFLCYPFFRKVVKYQKLIVSYPKK